MEKFLEKIKEKYTLEDFTGHIGVLLDEDYLQDENADQYIVDSAVMFLQDIYEMASKELV